MTTPSNKPCSFNSSFLNFQAVLSIKSVTSDLEYLNPIFGLLSTDVFDIEVKNSKLWDREQWSAS